jgi:hypothetical protein
MLEFYSASRELADWAHRAGFALESDKVNSYAVFHNSGWEDRLYIRSVGHVAGFRVTSASRSGNEQFEFDAVNSAVVEGYFWMFFGPSIRSQMDLPRVRYPVRAEEVAPGFSIQGPEGDHLYLVDPGGKRVMQTLDDVSDLAHLVKTSHGMSASTSEIIDSFTTESGQPLFELR